MKTIQAFCIFIILLLSSLLLKAQSPVPSRHITQFVDPIKEHLWSKVELTLNSKARNGFQRSRYCANLVFLKQGIENKDYYFLRVLLQTNLQEFPIQEEAYFILNSYTYPIKLIDSRSASFQIQDATSNMDSNGQIIQEIKTSDFQLFKKEAEVSQMMNDFRQIKKGALIIYSGKMPIVFNLNAYDCQKLELLLKY